MAALLRALRAHASQRPELLKLFLMIITALLGFNLLIRPLCEGNLQENSLPLEDDVIKKFPCSASGAARARYLIRRGFHVYPIFFRLGIRDSWAGLTHGLLLARLLVCCLVPPSFYRGHLSPFLHGLQRLLILLFQLTLSFPATSALKPSQNVIWCLKITPVTDVISGGLFQLGFWAEAVYGLVALVGSIVLALNLSRAGYDVDFKLPDIIWRQLVSTAVILTIEGIVRPMYNRHGLGFIWLRWRQGPRGRCAAYDGGSCKGPGKAPALSKVTQSVDEQQLAAEAAAGTSSDSAPGDLGSADGRPRLLRRRQRPASALSALCSLGWAWAGEAVAPAAAPPPPVDSGECAKPKPCPAAEGRGPASGGPDRSSSPFVNSHNVPAAGIATGGTPGVSSPLTGPRPDWVVADGLSVSGARGRAPEVRCLLRRTLQAREVAPLALDATQIAAGPRAPAATGSVEVGDGRGDAADLPAASSSNEPAPKPGAYQPYNLSAPLGGGGVPQLPGLGSTAAAAVAAVALPSGSPAAVLLPHRDGTSGPQFRSYVSRTRLISTTIKIRGVNPADVASGYQQRIAGVLAASNMELEGVYLRSGCIELVIDARSWAGRRCGAAAAAAVAAVASMTGGRGHCSAAEGNGPVDAQQLTPQQQHHHHSRRQLRPTRMAAGGSLLPLPQASPGGAAAASCTTSSSTSLSAADYDTAASNYSLSVDAALQDDLNADSAGGSPVGDVVTEFKRPLSGLDTDGGGGDAGGSWMPPAGRLNDYGVADDDDDGGGVDGCRSLDVGELIRALQLPHNSFTLEHSGSLLEMIEEPEDAGAAGVQRTDGLLAARAQGVTVVAAAAPPPPPQLLSVSPRVLPTRSCRGGGGRSGSGSGGGSGGGSGSASTAASTNLSSALASGSSSNSSSSSGSTRISANAGSSSNSNSAGPEGESDQAACVETVELMLLVTCAYDMVPELLLRSHGVFLPATVTRCTSVGAPATADAGGAGGGAAESDSPSDVLLCTIAVPLAAMPEEPGLLVVEVRWAGQTHGSVVPLLLADNAEVAAELQAAVEDWRGPPLELEDMLLDLACFLYHAGRLRRPALPAAAVHGTPAAAAENNGGVYDTGGVTAAVMRERVSELGLHLLTWMGSCPGAWLRSMARLQSDLVALGSGVDLLFQGRSSSTSSLSFGYSLSQAAAHQGHQGAGGDAPRGGGGGGPYSVTQGYDGHTHNTHSGRPGGGLAEEADVDDLRNPDNQKAAHTGDVMRSTLYGNVRPAEGQMAAVIITPQPPGGAVETAQRAVATGSSQYSSRPEYVYNGEYMYLLDELDGGIVSRPQGAGVGAEAHGSMFAMAAAMSAAAAAGAQEGSRSGALQSAPGNGSCAAIAAAAAAAAEVAAAEVAPGATHAGSGASDTAAARPVDFSGTPSQSGTADPWVAAVDADWGFARAKGGAAAELPPSLPETLTRLRWALAEYRCLATAGYQAFVAEYTAGLMHAIDVFTLTCLLVLVGRTWLETVAATPTTTVSSSVDCGMDSSGMGMASGGMASSLMASGVGPVCDPGERWRHFFRTLTPAFVSCLPSGIAQLSRPFLSRAAWLRLRCSLRVPQLLLFIVAGLLIGVLRFPAASAVRSHQLSACAFIGDGFVHILASMAHPITAATISLLRMPVHVALWDALGGNFGLALATARAAAVACLSVGTSVCCHAYLLSVYRRRCRQFGGGAGDAAGGGGGGGAGPSGAGRRRKSG